nr:MAG TPA: Prohead core protein serine protease [Caudoviricetes sp.]
MKKRIRKKKQKQAQLYMIRVCRHRGRDKKRKVKFCIGSIGGPTRNNRVYSEEVVTRAIQKLDQHAIPLRVKDGLGFDILEFAGKLQQQFPNWKADSSHPE